MGSSGPDPLEVDSPELSVLCWYGASARAIHGATVARVPASWPGLVRLPLVALATVVGGLATAVAWVPVTVVMAVNLLGRRTGR